MFINTFKKQKKKSPDGFRYRGREGSRLENLTDTIFGFSITLLIVASEVPETYLELQASMYSFIGFICSSMLLLGIWNTHRKFFLHYGLHNKYTRTLNFLFVFVLLFYIYPLKYLFSYLGTLVYSSIKTKFGDTSDGLRFAIKKLVEAELTIDQWADLIIRFGIGLLCIYTIFTILHIHALRKKVLLKLTKREVFITHTFLQINLILCAVSILSIVFVSILGGMYSGHGGLIYLIIPVALTLHRYFRKKKLNRKPWKKIKEEVVEEINEADKTIPIQEIGKSTANKDLASENNDALP